MKSGIPIKFIRFMLIVAALLAAILFIVLLVLQGVIMYRGERLSQEQNNTETSNYQPEESHPEAYTFLNNYFDQIKRGNFDTLVSSYWADSVRSEIVAKCSNPLGPDDIPLAQEWGKCASLAGIRVEIVDVLPSANGYEGLVQLYDSEGKIMGIELHPERQRGIKVQLVETSDGLRTPDWYFL